METNKKGTEGDLESFSREILVVSVASYHNIF